jgi:hypothetical protein
VPLPRRNRHGIRLGAKRLAERECRVDRVGMRERAAVRDDAGEAAQNEV